MSLLLVILTNSVITGCGKQEVVPAEEFNAGVVMHESAETEENTTVIQVNDSVPLIFTLALLHHAGTRI